MTAVPTATRLRVAAATTLLLFAGGGALACKADSVTNARTFGTLRFSDTDPAGDTLDNPADDARAAFDLTTTNVRFKGDSLIFALHFTGNVVRPSADNSVFGFVEMDTDQNAGTGAGAFANDVGATSGLGVDFRLHFSAGDKSARLEDQAERALLPLPARFEGDSIVIKVSRTQLGFEDGNFDFAVLVYTFDRDTDFAPNEGRYVVSATGTASVAATARRTRHARVDGSSGQD